MSAPSVSSKPIAAVTGSSGFIGTRLVEHLLLTGYRVRRLVRPSSRTTPAPNVDTARGVEIHAVEFDDPHSLRVSPALDGVRLVFHLAGLTKALTHDDFRRANVIPTVNLLRALADRPELERFVLVSSQAAAGPATSLDKPVTEDDPPRPIEAYGVSKLEAEEEARRCMSYLPITIIRPSSVYGPGDVDFLPLFRMAQQGFVLYPGTGSQYMSLLHVDDVVQALLAAATADATRGQTMFLASTVPVRWRDLGDRIGAAVGRRVRGFNIPSAVVRAAIPFGEAWARITGRPSLINRHKIELAGPRYWICSAERAARLFGFSPSRELAEGLLSTYSWYVREGWLTKATPVVGPH